MQQKKERKIRDIREFAIVAAGLLIALGLIYLSGIYRDRSMPILLLSVGILLHIVLTVISVMRMKAAAVVYNVIFGLGCVGFLIYFTVVH